jgi:Patatin-like phospholipase
MIEKLRTESSECPEPPAITLDVPNLKGLALSGGGIRSASFNLGFLQGLASREALGDFDYLSTVSGGGFIGAWWSAWLSRQGREQCDIFPQAEELESDRRRATAILVGDQKRIDPTDAPPDGSLSAKRWDPIHFVRLFSNYLTPKTGIMSPDTWRLIAYFVRSLLCTWLALVPLLLAAVLAAQSIFLFDSDSTQAFLGIGSTEAMIVNASESRAQTSPPTADRSATGGAANSAPKVDARLELLKIPALIFLVVYATMVITWIVESAASVWMALFAVLALLAVAWLLAHQGAGSSDVSRIAVAASIATLLVYGLRSFFKGISNPDPGPKANLGAAGGNAQPPVFRVYATSADRRTWLTQQQERLLKVGTFAGVLLLAAGFGHDILNFVFAGIDSGIASELKKAGGWGALLLTAVSGIYTLIKKAPSTTGEAGAKPSLAGELLMLVAPPLVVGTLLLAMALLSQHLIASTVSAAKMVPLELTLAALCLAIVEVAFAIYECYQDPDGAAPSLEFTWRQWYNYFSPRSWARLVALAGIVVLAVERGHLQADWWKQCPGLIVKWAVFAVIGAVTVLSCFALRRRVSLRSARPVVLLAIATVTAILCLFASVETTHLVGWTALLLAAVLIGCVIAFGWLTDPNLVSLHGFYKARIARAYLGASNTGRSNEEITDAVPGDDIPLKEVWNHDIGGPYHLINTSINLVGGSDLATSQRLAENFIMSRYHCGSARAGYRCTAGYMSGELSLATAVAVSGAAVSPEMGSKSPSAALSLLLSLFNVRLGFWAPTPSGKRWYESHARLWPFYLLRETLANTGTLGTYCYLTDGGHFDNTGLYALVERGCRYIIVCDCGADPIPNFEDIGTAVRRCRIDFGAEIALKVDDFVTLPNAQGIGSVQVAKGKIRYQPEHLQMLGMNPATEHDGVIIWVKPTVTASSAADVRQYRRAHSDFPQQSTAEQWYDESQFESYRRLGYESGLAFATMPAATGSGGQINPMEDGG